MVYTGDFVSYENNKQLEELKEVFQYAPKGKEASLAVLGNHDYGLNWRQPQVADEIVSILKRCGIYTLRNSKSTISGIDFIGLDDYMGTNFDPQKAMSSYDRHCPSIVLCHNPDVCDLNVWNSFQGWILSGHTHGGQCRLPYFQPPILPVKNKQYISGEFDLQDGRMLYINRALGHTVPVRFNVRPEITLFTMVKS